MVAQNIFAFGEWVEVGAIEKVARGETKIAVAPAPPPGEIEVFRKRVGFVVIVAGILAYGCAPAALRLAAIERLGRKMGLCGVSGPIKELESVWNPRELVSVDQTDNHLVVVIGGKTEVSVKTAGDGGSIKIDQPAETFARARIARDCVTACEGGDPLAGAVSRSKSMSAAFRFVQR
jgi:hypothetical protein